MLLTVGTAAAIVTNGSSILVNRSGISIFNQLELAELGHSESH
jgi:hypothetical protein